MHYFNFQIKEWIANTTHLTLEEEAIYLRLINYYYDSEKPIPIEGNPVNREFASIIRKLRLTSHYEAVLAILDEYFTLTEAGWIHERCDQELAKYHALIEGGKRGAEKRWGRDRVAMAPALGSECPTHALSNGYPMPIKNKELRIKNKESVIKEKAITPVGFDLFWSSYDKKVGKPNSIKAWSKITFNDGLLQIIIEQAKADKKAKPDNKFRKDPERWLKYRGWEDEIVSHETLAKELPLGTDQQIEQAYRVECGGDPTQARFNSYFEMKKFILDKRDRARV